MSPRRGWPANSAVANTPMSKKWDQVSEILGNALERPPAERLDFVRHACGEDEELRLEIESLLSNYDGADSLLENSAVGSLFSSHANSMAGRMIGAYRILSETG